jgi:hypothetical protein
MTELVELRARLESVLAPHVVQALEQFIGETVRRELERERAERRWRTFEQAAARYQTTPAALRKRAQRGRLPGAHWDESRWLLDISEFENALPRSRLVATDNEGPHRENGRPRGTGGTSSHAA